MPEFQSPIRPFPLRVVEYTGQDILYMFQSLVRPFPPRRAPARTCSAMGPTTYFNPLSGLSHCGTEQTTNAAQNYVTRVSIPFPAFPAAARRDHAGHGVDQQLVSIPYPAFPTAAHSKKFIKYDREFQSPVGPFPLRPIDNREQLPGVREVSIPYPAFPTAAEWDLQPRGADGGRFNPLSGLSRCGLSVCSLYRCRCGVSIPYPAFLAAASIHRREQSWTMQFQSPIRPFSLRLAKKKVAEGLDDVSIPYPAFLAAARWQFEKYGRFLKVSIPHPAFLAAAASPGKDRLFDTKFQSPIRPFSLRLNDKRFIGTVVTVSFNPLSGLSHCGTRPEAGGEEPAQ